MHSRKKELKKACRSDIGQLWKSLHDDSERFSESLALLIRKTKEGKEYRSRETMFATYLSVMIKADNRLFLGTTYWDINSSRVDRVYRLLMTYGYAERIIELALGAADLFAVPNPKGNRGKTEKLREIADRYKAQLEEHRLEYPDNGVSRKAGWDMIRISNKVFATVYDIVEGELYNRRQNDTYCKILKEPSDWEQKHGLYMDTFDRLFEPRIYMWKKILNKLKPPKINRRKKIDWRILF